MTREEARELAKKLVALATSDFEEEARTSALVAAKLIREHSLLDAEVSSVVPILTPEQVADMFRDSMPAPPQATRFRATTRGYCCSCSRSYNRQSYVYLYGAEVICAQCYHFKRGTYA